MSAPAKKKGAALKKGAKKALKAKAIVKGKKVVKKAQAVIKTAPKKQGPTPPAKATVSSPGNRTQYTQAEFFDGVRGFCGFQTRREAKEFYASLVGMLQASLKSGYKIALPGLGKMQVRRSKARMGRNPMTGETIQIPARKKVAFTANKALKQAVL